MRLQYYLPFFLFFLPLLLHAQSPLQPGFDLLDSGRFAQAEQFFAEVLQRQPGDRTARICYGRAVGLNGRAEAALRIFSDLQQEYPQDQEIQINMAEALMWGRRYTEAAELYDRLLQRDTLDFTANLGAANARAGERDYVAAIPFIQRALVIEPRNANARISQKFIFLGRADQLKRNWEYAAAHHYLDTIETMFPGDHNARLLRSDILLAERKYRSAQQIYHGLLGDSIEIVRAYNGLSYTSMLLNRKKDALSYALKAVAAAERTQLDSSLRLQADIQYVNALGFNHRYREAMQYLDQLETERGRSMTIDMARARMQVWSRDLQPGIDGYESLLQENTPSFDLLMGMAEAQRAAHELDAALEYVQQARQLLPDQPDAYRMWQQIRLADRPALQLTYSQLQDNGGNAGRSREAKITLGRFGRWQPFAAAGDWQAGRSEAVSPARQSMLSAGSTIRLNPYLKARIGGGAITYRDTNDSRQTALQADLGINFLLGKYHQFDLGYTRDLHNYTVELVQEGIARNHIGVSYHFAAPTRLGLYAQYLRTYQSDGNRRNLIFASLYFRLLEAPQLKVGMNYNTFSFARQESEKYFSPRSSQAMEAFIQLNSDLSADRRFFYQATFAKGIQRIAIFSSQQTTRLELSLGYRPRTHIELAATFQMGNTVQSSVSGYAYTRAGLQLRYQLPVAATHRSK